MMRVVVCVCFLFVLVSNVFECVVCESSCCYAVLLLCLCVSLNALMRFVCDFLCETLCVVCVFVRGSFVY